MKFNSFDFVLTKCNSFLELVTTQSFKGDEKYYSHISLAVHLCKAMFHTSEGLSAAAAGQTNCKVIGKRRDQPQTSSQVQYQVRKSKASRRATGRRRPRPSPSARPSPSPWPTPDPPRVAAGMEGRQK